MSASAFDLTDSLYHPFCREDQYGALGMKQQSLLEYARLAFLIVFALPVKFTGCLLCISAVWIVCRSALPHLLRRLDAWSSRQGLAQI